MRHAKTQGEILAKEMLIAISFVLEQLGSTLAWHEPIFQLKHSGVVKQICLSLR